MTFRFMDLPMEIREMVYGQVLHPALNRRKDRDAYIKYSFNLSLFRVSRAVSVEAQRAFYALNHFALVETPWPQAQEAVEKEGYVPILIRDAAAAGRFLHDNSSRRRAGIGGASLTVKIDAPGYTDNISPADYRRMVIHADDLPAFAEFWMYQDLTHRSLNMHMRLTLSVRNPHVASSGSDDGDDPSRATVAKSLQKRLLEPFGVLRNLQGLVVEGSVYPSIEKALRDAMATPYRSPEECLDEAAAHKDKGNALLARGDHRGAITAYEASFRSLHIVCDGRRRSVFGEGHFQAEMRSGRFKGQNGGLQRLILRVRLVANIVYAYLKLEEFAWAKFWGKRTIMLFRNEVDFDDGDEESIFDFPAANEMGKIYYRTGVAYKMLGKKDKARALLKVAMAYLPNDPQVRSEHASVALQLG